MALLDSASFIFILRLREFDRLQVNKPQRYPVPRYILQHNNSIAPCRLNAQLDTFLPWNPFRY